jgi:hypothetical protein
VPPVDNPTDAFLEFHRNIEYARDLVKGGRRLEQLQVGAFDVGDIYRAAWVQALAALDHWVYRELVDRAVTLIQQPGTPRPERFKKLTLSVDFFEKVHHYGEPLDVAFRAHVENVFQTATSPNPDKIQWAFSHIKSGKLWPKVARVLTGQRTDGLTITDAQVVARLRGIVERRNRIAHESDRDPSSPNGKRPINAADTMDAIAWIEMTAAAVLWVLSDRPAPSQ